MRIIDETSKTDGDWSGIRFPVIAKKHSIIKDCHYSRQVKQLWLQCQQSVLDQDGHQNGNGKQKVAQPIHNMPYATTHAGVEADCCETLVRTMKASLMVMAAKVFQATNKEVRDADKQTLNVMQSRQWLRLVLNTDKEIIERQTLGHFDASESFQPMKT